MSRYGITLFHRSKVLTRYLEELPAAVHAAISDLLLQKECTREELLEELRPAFLLPPLRPTIRMWTLVERGATLYSDAAGTNRTGYFVQGHVPYTGSKLLWQVSPQRGYRFPFKAKIGTKAVKICSLIDDQDIAPFTLAADIALEELRDVLHAFQPQVGGYNDRIRAELELQVRTY